MEVKGDSMMADKEKIVQVLRERSRDGKIPCPVALQVAKELGVPTREVGRLLDELKIKVVECQLGLFHEQKQKK